jgi:hypothetical protein
VLSATSITWAEFVTGLEGRWSMAEVWVAEEGRTLGGLREESYAKYTSCPWGYRCRGGESS